MKDTTYYLLQSLIWAVVTVCCVAIFFGFLSYLSHPFTDINYHINISMDNNTLEAFKSINWSAIPK